MLRTETTKTIGDWLFEDILCRWGSIREIVTDNGPTFLKALAYLTILPISASAVTTPTLTDLLNTHTSTFTNRFVKPSREIKSVGHKPHTLYFGPSILQSASAWVVLLTSHLQDLTLSSHSTSARQHISNQPRTPF